MTRSTAARLYQLRSNSTISPAATFSTCRAALGAIVCPAELPGRRLDFIHSFSGEKTAIDLGAGSLRKGVDGMPALKLDREAGSGFSEMTDLMSAASCGLSQLAAP